MKKAKPEKSSVHFYADGHGVMPARCCNPEKMKFPIRMYCNGVTVKRWTSGSTFEATFERGLIRLTISGDGPSPIKVRECVEIGAPFKETRDRVVPRIKWGGLTVNGKKPLVYHAPECRHRKPR